MVTQFMSTRQIIANIHLWNMRILNYSSFITTCMWYHWLDLGKNIQWTILKTNKKTFEAASAPAPFTYYSDLCRDFHPHFLYTLDTLQLHSSSIWVSTALATFACKRKPLTVYFSIGISVTGATFLKYKVRNHLKATFWYTNQESIKSRAWLVALCRFHISDPIQGSNRVIHKKHI